MIETKGYCAIIEAADVMLKTSQVKLVALERIGSSLLTVMVVGDVGAVESAVAAGCEHAKKLGDLIAYKVIPRPHDEVGEVLQGMAKYFAPEEKTAQAPPEKATPEDLKAVAQNWSKIVLKSGRLLRAVLENSVPKYNAQTGDNILYLAVNTPNNGFGLSERNLMELQDIIQETIHKSVEIQEVTMKNDGPSLRDLEIEQTLSREIDFPVSVEENPEEW